MNRLRLVFLLAGAIQLLNYTCEGAVLYPGRGGGGLSPTIITNLINAANLWTNDVFGDQTVLRPIDQARTIEHQMTSSNYYGLELMLMPTNGAGNANYSIGIYGLNRATNSAAHVSYWGLGKYGIVGETDDEVSGLLTGESAGILGVSDGSFNSQFGVVGLALGQENAQTNIGVKGIAADGGSTGGKMIGGYFEVSPTSGVSTTPSVGVTAAVVGNVLADYPIFSAQTSSVPVLTVGSDGDLDLIKSLAYSWPSARGGANSVLMDTDNSGTLAWRAVGFGVGPGTNTFLSMFNSTGTNVINSPISSPFTNSIAQFLLPNGGTFTNGATTNRMYAMFAHANTNSYLEFVSPPPFANQAAHIRAKTIGFSSQNPPIYINDAIAIEPLTDQIGGHGTGFMYPLTDGNGSTGQSLGTTALSWHGVFSDKWGFVADPNNDACIFTDATGGGHGFGISTSGALYLTGPGFAGIQFNSAGLLGAAILDINSYGVGFGSTVSNVQASLRFGSAAGFVAIGTNSSVASPTGVGIMGAPASGSDKGGPSVTYAGSQGTGNGTAGKILFATAGPGASGSTVQTLTNRMEIAADTGTVTIYSNLVVNGTISGTSGPGNALTNNNVNSWVIFTNNQVSIRYDASGIFVFTNSAASSVGLTWNTNGIVTFGTKANVDSFGRIYAADGTDAINGNGVVVANTSKIGFHANNGVGIADPPATYFDRPASGVIQVNTNLFSRGYMYQTAQINTTAGTANNWTSNNIYCGRVRISSGSQSYFITNTAVTTSSIVVASVNTADATAFSCQAIPAAGLLTLKLNGVAAGDCDISWRIVSP